MQIAENVTLGIAILWTLLQLIGLRHSSVNGKKIFIASIPGLIFFIISIIIIIIFRLSPLHLIWMAVACYTLGLIAIVFLPVQNLSMRLVNVLSLLNIDSQKQ